MNFYVLALKFEKVGGILVYICLHFRSSNCPSVCLYHFVLFIRLYIYYKRYHGGKVRFSDSSSFSHFGILNLR